MTVHDETHRAIQRQLRYDAPPTTAPAERPTRLSGTLVEPFRHACFHVDDREVHRAQQGGLLRLDDGTLVRFRVAPSFGLRPMREWKASVADLRRDEPELTADLRGRPEALRRVTLMQLPTGLQLTVFVRAWLPDEVPVAPGYRGVATVVWVAEVDEMRTHDDEWMASVDWAKHHSSLNQDWIVVGLTLLALGTVIAFVCLK